MQSVLQDIRYGIRTIRRAPAIAVLAAITLGLGIGANTTLFRLVDAVLLRPLPGVGDTSRVATLGIMRKNHGFDNSSYLNYRDLRDQNTVFTDVAANHPVPVSLTTGGSSERVAGEMISANYFRTLGVSFAVGRGFLESEDRGEESIPNAVIGYGLWERMFGRIPDILGRPVDIDGRRFTIVGVTVRGFIGTDAMRKTEVWLPISARRIVLPSFMQDEGLFQARDWEWLMLFARLKPGISWKSAEADVQTIAARLRNYPENEGVSWRMVPGVGLEPDERAELVRLTQLLMGVAGLLLLLTCSNVANLILAKEATRRREITVRLALGASRRRLTQQLLTESLLLALLGGAAAMLLSLVAIAAMSEFFARSSRFPLALSLSPDLRLVLFTGALAMMSGAAFGLVPRLQLRRGDVAPALQATSTRSTGQSPIRPVLAAVQITLSFVLLVGSGLLLRTIHNFTNIPTRFNSGNVVLVTVDPTITGKYDDKHLRIFYEQLQQRLASIPEIGSVGIARLAPVTALGWSVAARVPDRPGSSIEHHSLQFNTVSANYFDVMDIPIIHGRAIGAQDTESSPLVMVVNETLAETLWPGEEAVGKQIWVQDEGVPRQVVGIAADIKYRSLVEQRRPFAYFSMSQPYPLIDAPAVIHLRTRLSPARVAVITAREAHALDPSVPVFGVERLTEHVADSYWRQQLTAMVMGTFAFLALIVAAVGLYGLMACVVSERTREIGIRMALGAQHQEVMELILGQAMRLTLSGIAAGLAIALSLSQLLANLLLGISAHDPVTFATVLLFLIAVSLLASYIPGRRALSVEPVIALRCE